MKVRDHVALATFCGLLVGIGEGARVAVRAVREGGTSVPVALIVCTGVISTIAFCWGWVQGGLGWLAARAARRTNAVERLLRYVTSDREQPREPVIRFHALVLSTAASLALAVVGFAQLLRALHNIGDETLKRSLTLTGFAVTVLATAAAAVGLFCLLQRPLGALDRRFGLPRPRSRLLSYLVYLALPALAVSVPLLVRTQRILGLLVVPIWLLLFVMGEGLVALLWRWVQPGPRRPPWALQIGVLAGWLVMLVACLVVFARFAHANEALRRAPISRAAAGLLRSVTDLDRDGFSSLFGGGDCAAWDDSINPLAHDLPDNGIDEDCDGTDAAPLPKRKTRPAAQWYGQLEPSLVRRYNIVWFVVEATRADHCQFAGYRKPTTPYLYYLAKESMVFPRAFTQSSATMLSLPSMFTGRIPGSITWKKSRGKLQLSTKHLTLAERLKQLGYRTYMVADRYLKGRMPGLFQGFDEVSDTWLDGKRMPWYRRNTAIAVTQAIDMLEHDGSFPKSESPFFLVVYASDPHEPYNGHKEAFPNFGKDELGRYDAEIAFTDRYLGFFVDYLRYQQPVWDNTLLLFNGDHGEEFGEHGGTQHANTCYRESTNVPLLIRIPGFEGKRVNTPIAMVDVVPTLLELLGEDQGDMELDGQSLFLPALSPTTVDQGRPIFCSVLSQKASQGNFFRRAVRSGEHLLIHDSVGGSFELYDTEHDRGERQNLMDDPRRADVAEDLKRVLAESLTGNLAKKRLTK